MEEKNIKRGRRAGVTFKLRAIEMAGENYERRHSSIAAPSIENIFPNVSLNYSHTSSSDSKESLSLSVELIIGKIVVMKESDGENENDSNGTKYL